MNALANAAAGKGYESLQHLNDTTKWGERAGRVKLHFLDIENIHAMRGSYQNMTAACDACESEPPSYDLAGAITATGWYHHVSLLLKGAAMVSEQLEAGNAVLCHCSDGWDRTAQITALAQLMLDPFARTLYGLRLGLPQC